MSVKYRNSSVWVRHTIDNQGTVETVDHLSQIHGAKAHSRPSLDWLITSLSVTGGAETFTVRFAPLLAARGWSVRLITLAGGGMLAEQLHQSGIPVINLDAAHTNDIRVVPRLLRLWSQDPPGIVHTHLYHAGLLGRVAARLCRVPRLIVHQHGLEQNRSPLRSLLDRATSLLVDNYAVSCRAVAQVIETRERIAPHRIRLVYNGIDPSQYAAPSGGPPPGWPVPAGAPVIGTLGRLAPEKDQSNLLRALAMLQDLDPPAHLVLVGDGPLRQPLADLVARLGLSGRIHLVGSQHQVYPWLAHFTVFALPSLWEGLSMALLEAMAASRPVVASAVGGTLEALQHEGNGLLVPPADPAALAVALRRMLLEPALRQRLGASARRTIVSRFTLDRTLHQLEEIYQGPID